MAASLHGEYQLADILAGEQLGQRIREGTNASLRAQVWRVQPQDMDAAQAATITSDRSGALGGMHLGGVTTHPTGDWTVRQARNLALTLGERFESIRFLVREIGRAHV